MSEVTDKTESEDQALLPIKEDITIWLSGLLGMQLPSETFFDTLQTGTVLCQAAHAIHDAAFDQSLYNTENTNYDTTFNGTFPKPPKFSLKAKPGSFLARDNVANFITWCRGFGIKDTYMFESEDVVLQKQKRNVLLCLLEIARISSKFGVSMPELIHLENDIEREESSTINLMKSIGCKADIETRIPPSQDKRKRKKVLQLDDAVFAVTDNLKKSVEIERMGDCLYRIHDNLVSVRMLREQHVMVRVGGGWDTLKHYLQTHNTGVLYQQNKLLSFTDGAMTKKSKYRSNERKFHQIRTRIPLRMKQC
ncbi:growth arrest-specific protein 2-like [Styela clava]